MSHRAEEGTVNLGELDKLACEVSQDLLDRGVTSHLIAAVGLFMFAKSIVMSDVDEGQAIETLRELLRILRAMRPS